MAMKHKMIRERKRVRKVSKHNSKAVILEKEDQIVKNVISNGFSLERKRKSSCHS